MNIQTVNKAVEHLINSTPELGKENKKENKKKNKSSQYLSYKEQ